MDIQLMHHFSTCTYATLAQNEELLRVWQVVIPNESFSHEFLMRGILAVSALHLAHLDPQKNTVYTQLSAFHQDFGLKGFRASLTNVTEDNRAAVFAFASLLVPYVCAVMTKSATRSLTAPIDNAIDLLVVVRGIEIIVCDDTWLPNSSLAPFAHGAWAKSPPHW